MTPQTVLIYCDRAPVPWQVAAVRERCPGDCPKCAADYLDGRILWRCSWCGARVKVIA